VEIDAMHSLRLQVTLKKFDARRLGGIALDPEMRRREFDGIAMLATFDSRMGSKFGIIGKRINKPYHAFLPANVTGATGMSRSRLRDYPHSVTR